MDSIRTAGTRLGKPSLSDGKADRAVPRDRSVPNRGTAQVGQAANAARSSLRSRRGLPTSSETGAGRSSIALSSPRTRCGLPTSGAEAKVVSALSLAMGVVLMWRLISLARGVGNANVSGRLLQDDAQPSPRMATCGLLHAVGGP